jgi:hypothetical protein
MADTLTPEEKKRLTEELTKYANEGASDDDLRQFRNAFISELKKKGGGQPASGAPAAKPTKPSAPSFGQKVVSEVTQPQIKIPLRGKQKPPVAKKPYQDIYYKPEGLPSETTQIPETPVIKAAKQDFKQTQLKPQIQPVKTAQELEEIEKKTEKADKTGLVLNEYQSSADALNELNRLKKDNANEFYRNIKDARPDLYEKYSGRTIQEGRNIESDISESQKDRDIVYQNYLSDLQRTDESHRNTLSKVGPIVNSVVDKKVTPENYKRLTTSHTTDIGGDVVDMGKVDDEATAIAEKYNLPTDGEAWRLLKNKIKSNTDFQIIKPQAEELFKQNYPELHAKRQKMFEDGFKYDDEIYSKVESELTSLQNQYEADAKNELNAIDAEYKSKSELLNQQYKDFTSQSEKVGAELDNLYKSGQIDRLEYENRWGLLQKEKKDYYDLYEKQFPSLDEYVKKSNEINSKYNRKFELQKKALTDKAQAQIKAEFDKYSTNYKEDPAVLEELNKAYRDSYELASDIRTKTMGLGAEMSSAPMSKLYQSTLSSLGGVFKGWGGSLDSKTLELLGESMEQNFMMPAARTEEFKDWLDPQNLQLLTGQLLGSMAPSMAITAAVATSTGGTGIPAIVPMITGGLAGWASETVDIVGRSYLDMFEKSGGDVAKSNKAAERSLKSQYDLMWAYSFDALPFVGKVLGGIPTKVGRVAAGAGIEMGTEFLQEYPQNIAEENIQKGLDPWTNLGQALRDTKKMKETLISIGPVAILGGAGQLGSKSAKQEAVDTYVAMQQKAALSMALPDQKRQYIQNMVFDRGGKFARGVVGAMFADGTIDEETSKDLLVQVENSEKIQEAGKGAGLKGSKLNIYGFYSARAEEAERNAAKFGNDPILSESYKQQAKQYRDAGLDFMKGNNPDLLTVTYADGSQAMMTPEDVNGLFSNPIALTLLNRKKISVEAYREGGQGGKALQELTERADAYKQSKKYVAPNKTEDEVNASFEAQSVQEKEQKKDTRDIEIEQIQQQREALGVSEVDAFFSDMKPLVATMVERMEAGQAAPQSGVKAASDYLYAKYKELTAMKADPNRMMTIAQIESIQAQIEQDLQTLAGNPPSQQTQTNDQENIQGLPSEVGVGQEPIAAQPVQVTSEEAPATGGVLQTPGEKVVEVKLAELPTVTVEGQAVEVTPTTEAAAEQVGTQPSIGINQKAESVETSSIQERAKATNAKIKRKDIFDGVGVFSEKLGGSDVESVPVGHSEIGNAEIVQYANPKTGIIDVIVAGITENDFVGFYRIYENGKPTNRWSSKFETQTASKEDFKSMISGVQNALPQGHEYTETTSISTDGLRVWNQQLNRGYELQYDEKGKLVTTPVYINGDSKTNILGIPVNKGAFDAISVTNADTFNKVKEVLLPFLEKFGLNETNIRAVNGSVEIDLPVLRQKATPQVTPQVTPESAPVTKPSLGQRLRIAAEAAETTVTVQEPSPVKEEKKEGVAPAPKTEEKPTRKTRLAKLFETSEGEEAVPLIEQSLSESGIKVDVKDDADYNNDDRIKRSQGRGSEGMFVADDGTIILNRDKIKGEWGKTIVFHEGIHPVVNIIRNTDPKRYRAIVDGLKSEAARNNAVAKAAADIAASEEYQRRGPESIEDETVVETMARVATGDIDINTFKPSFREKFIEFMNDIAKVFGLRPILTNSPRVEVKRLAEQINKMLNEGGKISDVVGKKNVGKFQNTISDGQYSIDARIADKGVQVPRSEKLPLKIVASKEESVMRRINELLDKYPNALTDKEQWKELMSRVFPITVDGEVFIPAFPEGLSRMAGSVQETLKEINKVSDEQRKLASEGLKGTKEIGELYKQGKMDEVDTGLYFLWNIMSIGISPYPQESGFLQAVNGGVDKYIKLAAAGKFNESTLKEYLNWVDGVLPKGTPGAGSKSNLNSFGKSFLSKAAQEIESGEFEGKTKLQALHEILSDRKTPTNELRRKWQANMSAMQFNNKIFDFILLTTGRSDLFVTDRVRVDHFWDGNNFKKKRGLKESTSLYDGSDLAYGAATGAGFSKILSDVPGLVFNELANRTMTPIVEKAYKQIGVKDYPEVGRFHWETWVAASSQEVSHGSIDAIVQRKEKGEIQDAGIRQGKYGAWDFNFAYKKRAGKDFVYEFVDNDGNTYVFDKINDIQDEIEKQKKKTYETNNRFLLPDAKGNISRPTKGLSTAWYDTELVDAEKYFEFLRSKAKEIIPAPDVVEDQGVVIEKPKSEKISKEKKPTGQPSQGIPRTPKEFAGNVGETIDRIKAATSEDGATLNLDGTTYEDGGLVVPAGSLNVAQDEVTAEGLFEFLKDNEENISSDIFKIGLYKFPDRPEVSYDLNIVIPREYRDVALKFGELSGQESLFDLDTFENIKTGSDGKNPRKFTAQELAEIAKDLSEGRLPKIVSKEEIDRKWGEKKMIALTKREDLGTKTDREIAAYASKFLNKFGPYTKANVVQIMNMSAEEKIKLINDTFEARVKKMNPAFREPGNDFYDQSVKRRDEVLALVTKPTGQPSMMKRTPAQIRQAVEDGVDAVEAAIAEGVDPQQAVDENISNQEWYGDLSAAQKEQLNEILQDEFGATASEPKLQNNAQRVADLWEKGGKEAKAEIKNILETDPELSYIYNNFPKITKQLQEQGLLTKTENCP